MSETSPDTVTLHEAVEHTLSSKAESEPGFLERAIIDPRGVVGPILAELAGDDGDLDLSGVAVNIHVQTPDALHFVMTAPAAETTGFSFGGFDLGLMGLRVELGAKSTTKIEKSKKADDARCHTDTTSTCKPCPSELRSW